MFTRDDYKSAVIQLGVGAVLILGALLVPGLPDWVLKDVTLPRLAVILPAIFGLGLVAHLGFRVKRLNAGGSVAQITASEPTALAPAQEWESYTQDRILDIEWQWRWHGTSIQSLTPLCPKCGMELSENTRPSPFTRTVQPDQLHSVECHNMDCKWHRGFDDQPHVETPAEFRVLVMKHIRRKARGLGLPP